MKVSHHVQLQNQHFKMNGNQRRTPKRMHCMCCGMPIGTSQANLNSEIIKPIMVSYAYLKTLVCQFISIKSNKRLHSNFLGVICYLTITAPLSPGKIQASILYCVPRLLLLCGSWYLKVVLYSLSKVSG